MALDKILNMRHPQHDYSMPGSYFVTFVTAGREQFLGRVRDESMYPSDAGRIVEACWRKLPDKFEGLQLDAFQLMPDHVHCIICKTAVLSNEVYVPPSYKLSGVVSSLKSASSGLINQKYGTKGRQRWQKSFVDRVIRNEQELEKLRHYVLTNPMRWET